MQVKSFTAALLIPLICVNIFLGNDTGILQLFNKKGVVVNPLCEKRNISLDQNTTFHAEKHPVKISSNQYCHWCYEITFWKEKPHFEIFIKESVFSYLNTDNSVYSEKDHPPPKDIA